MPSNALKISAFIAALQSRLEQHGDIDVVIPIDAEQFVVAVSAINVTATSQLPWYKFPLPVLALGFSPGQHPLIYAADHTDASEWNYDLMSAEEGVDVRVWKRFGGQDKGARGPDGWSVYEGGERAWRVPDGAVMAWLPL